MSFWNTLCQKTSVLVTAEQRPINLIFFPATLDQKLRFAGGTVHFHNVYPHAQDNIKLDPGRAWKESCSAGGILSLFATFLLHAVCTVAIWMPVWNWYRLWLKRSNEWLISTENSYQRVTLGLGGSFQETDGIEMYNQFMAFPKMLLTVRARLVFKYKFHIKMTAGVYKRTM